MPTCHSRRAHSLLLCCALVLAGVAHASDAKPKTKTNVEAEAEDTQVILAQPFVTVNGEVQTNARAEILLREYMVRGAKNSPELRATVQQILVIQAIMAQEARKANLHKNPLLQAQIELAEQDLLAQAWQQKVLAETPPDEVAIKAEYDRQFSSLGDTDYRVRHLLLKDEATAKSLIKKIKSGARLADLAIDHSLDTETRLRGGITDWTNVAMLLPPLAEALKPLAHGQVAPNPVKTDAGWHVLQLEDRRPFQTMSQDQARPQMQAVIARRKLDARIQELTQNAKVK
jgi:peptidyl-prolyl cis-trans isomerase C